MVGLLELSELTVHLLGAVSATTWVSTVRRRDPHLGRISRTSSPQVQP